MSEPIFDRRFDPQHGSCIDVAPGIRRVVAANPSAFTFHGTGTYIIGTDRVAVIDPGPALDSHLQALLEALAGKVVEAILITHTHLDHSPLARPLQAACGAPIYGYGPHGSGFRDRVEEGADRDFTPDHRMADGDIVAGDGWSVEAVHTPGHTSNHLCFAYREAGALFSGDHVMGWSTSVISPPDGNMADYMASLEKLLHRPEDLYYPTHGSPIRDAKDHVQSFIDHRRSREQQITACIAQGMSTIATMVPAIYRDVPEKLHPAAARSVLAHLIHMTETGRVFCDSETATLTSVYRLQA